MELFSYQVFLGKEDSLHVYIFFFLASVLHKTNMIQSVSLDTCIFNSVIRISFYILILCVFAFVAFWGCYTNRSILLAVIVEKSKKCLDFSVTLFTLHLLLCTLYDGFPSSWDWWILNILGLIIMVLLGEYFCSRLELREIPLL